MSRASAVVPSLAFAVAAALFSGCGDRGVPAESRPATPPATPLRTPLLERAVEAQGGRDRLLAVRTLETRATVADGPLDMRTRVQLRLPDAYRDEVETEEARFVRVWQGGSGWAALDDVAYALTDEESAAVRESLRLTSLSLLVNLDAEHGVVVRELPPEAGVERLEVRFDDAPEGPFLLTFEAATTRLSGIAWETTIVGRRGKTRARYALDDWRDVDGLVAPFRARLFLEEAEATDARIVAISVNPTLPPEAFDAPKGPAPIVLRDLAAQSVALLERRESDGAFPPSDAEEKLAAFVANRGLTRSGPVFRRLADGTYPPAVGVAVVAPRTETRPASSPAESIRVTTRAAGRALTVVVKNGDESALQAAAARLATEAPVRGLVPAGAVRVVAWSKDLVQVQLPVEAP